MPFIGRDGTTAFLPTTVNTSSSLTVSGEGDLIVDTNTLFVDSSANKVGIGTVSPTSIFDVEIAAGAGINFSSSSDTAPTINFMAGSSSLESAAQILVGENNGGGDFIISTKNTSGALTTRVTVNNSGKVKLPDNGMFVAGADDDLQIYHNGTQSRISLEAGTDLMIRNKVADRDIIISTDDGNGGGSITNYFRADGSTGEVRLFHYGNLKFATKSTGVSVTGQIDIGTTSILSTGDISMGDNDKLKLGDGNDLQIYHNATNSYIENTTGDLYLQCTGSGDDILIQSMDDIFLNPQGGNNGVNILGAGAVELYYNNQKRIETESNGAKVTGILDVTSDFKVGGASNILVGGTALPSLTGLLGGSLSGTLSSVTMAYLAAAPNNPVQGQFYFNSLSSKAQIYTGSAFVDLVPSGGGGGGGGGSSTDAQATFRKYTYSVSGTTSAISGAADGVTDAGAFVTGRKYQIKTVGNTDFTAVGSGNNNVGTIFTATGAGSGTGDAYDVLVYVTNGSQNVEVYVNGVKAVEGSSNDYVATSGTSVNFVANLASGDVVDILVYELLTNDAFVLASGGTFTGNVGINTTSIQNRLHIHSNANDQGILLTQAGSNYNSIIADTDRTAIDNYILNIQANWDGNDVALITFETGDRLSNKDDGRIKFSTSSSGHNPVVRMHITPSGNVGIGQAENTNATARLQVKGDGALSGTHHKYMYATDCGILVRGNEAGIDLIGSDAGSHSASILLRNADDGFGFVNSATGNSLILKSFTTTADDFYIHASGSQVSALVDVVTFNKTGDITLGAAGSSLHFQNGFNNSTARIQNGGGSNNSELKFLVKNAGTESEKMRLTSTAGLAVVTAGSMPANAGNETLYVMGEGHTGHGTSNTRSVVSIIGALTSNSAAAGIWMGARTNDNTAVIGTRTASGNLAFETYNGGWGERMRLTSAGRLLIGHAGEITGAYDNSPQTKQVQIINGANNGNQGLGIYSYSSDGWAPRIELAASRSSSFGGHTVVTNGQSCGLMLFNGSDGTDFSTVAMIGANVNGTPADNSIPGSLSFYTSPGAGLKERLRITHDGKVQIGDIADNSASQTLCPVYIDVHSDITTFTAGEGAANTGLVRIEETGSNANRYHGIELRNRQQGDIRIMNLDVNSNNYGDLVIAVPDQEASAGLHFKARFNSLKSSIQIAGKGGATLSNSATEHVDVYIATKTGITAINTAPGAEVAGTIRFEDKGANNNRYHGLELRNRNSGDVRIFNHDQGASNTADMVFGVDNGSDVIEALRIHHDGHISQGTVAPPSNAEFTIRGANPELSLYATANYSSYLMMGDTNDYDNGYIEYDNYSPSKGFKFIVGASHRVKIDNSGTLTVGASNYSFGSVGARISQVSDAHFCRNDGNVIAIRRNSTDGSLIDFYQDGGAEGSISVSGSTVSLVGGHLSRWTQLPGNAERIEILRGTVLSNLDEMCEWSTDAQEAVLYTEEDELPRGVNIGDVKIPAREANTERNEQLNRMKVSDVEGDVNVAGVFQSWDDDDDTYTNDYYCAMTGDFVIRIAQGTTVARGDLLMSAGDGTAKPQDDDIIRSKTIAKVTSTHVSHTHPDGSYCVPCVLMAC